MKSCRRDIIHSFINKLTTNNITQVSRVLKGIFEGIGVGEYGKKDLNEILAEENIDEVIIASIKNNKDRVNWSNIVTEVLGFIYKLSYKVKVYISTLKGIWNELKEDEAKRREYYKWVN
jgi:SOS response regulatory protein OraA/RecX